MAVSNQKALAAVVTTHMRILFLLGLIFLIFYYFYYFIKLIEPYLYDFFPSSYNCTLVVANFKALLL